MRKLLLSRFVFGKPTTGYFRTNSPPTFTAKYIAPPCVGETDYSGESRRPYFLCPHLRIALWWKACPFANAPRLRGSATLPSLCLAMATR